MREAKEEGTNVAFIVTNRERVAQFVKFPLMLKYWILKLNTENTVMLNKLFNAFSCG